MRAALATIFAPDPPDRLWTPVRYGAMALFVLVTGLLVVVHEPWRDEAQAWLLARDADLWRLVSYHAGHEATPVLWHLVNIPLAQAGLPFVAQRIVNAVFVIAAAWLVLWRAPFPPGVRLGVVFSGYLLFEYNAVARSYGLGAMLLFLALALDGQRARRPLLYGAVLGCLANTHVFGLFLAFGLGLAWLGDLRGEARGRLLAGMALALAAGLAATWQILPPDDSFRGGSVAPPHTANEVQAVYTAGLALVAEFWKIQPLRPRAPAAAALLAGIWLVLLWRLRPAPRGVLLFAVMGVGLMYIAIFERSIDARHAYQLMLGYIGALWLGGAAIWHGRSAMEWLNRAVLAGVLVLSSMSGIHDVYRDVRKDYSPGPGMAAFLLDQGLADRPIVADRPPHGSAILPYMPETRLWYPALNGWGTYIVWRSGVGAAMSVAELRDAIAAEGFEDALILTERRLGEGAPQLLHVEHSLHGRLYLYDAADWP